jgi:hypothetical protein
LPRQPYLRLFFDKPTNNHPDPEKRKLVAIMIMMVRKVDIDPKGKDPNAIATEVDINARNSMKAFLQEIHSDLVIGVVNNLRRIPSFRISCSCSILP